MKADMTIDTHARRGRVRARRSRRDGGASRSVVSLAVWAAAILVGLLALGWLLSRAATGNEIAHTDDSLTRWLAGHRTATWTEASAVATLLAETVTVILVGVLASAGARLAFRRWREPLLIVAAVAGEVLVFLAVTALVDRERPAIARLDEAPPTSSFPSGHVAAAIVLYGAIAVLLWHWVGRSGWRALIVALAVAIPVLVAAARVYRGMHYVSDIAGGVLLGTTWLAVCVRTLLNGARPGRRAGGRPRVADARRRTGRA
jgi:membrane-associated phospholipid phosphatase